MTRFSLALIFICTCLAAPLACGGKSKPPRPAATPDAPTPTGTPAPDDPAVDDFAVDGPDGPEPADQRPVTAGGVTLPANTPAAIVSAASELAVQRPAATRALINAGEAARPVAHALLVSANIEELLGALAWHAAFPDAVETGVLLGALRHDAPTVRGAAAKALGAITGELPAAPLIAALTDERRDLRALAARLLRRADATTALPALGKALTDRDETVAIVAATTLAERGDADVFAPVLTEHLTATDATESSTRACLVGLRLMGRAAPKAAIIAAMISANRGLAAEGARAVARFGDAASRAPLIAIGAASNAGEVRRALLEGLAAVGATRGEAIALAAQLAGDTDADVRARAAGVQGQLLPAGARLTALTTALGDAEPRVRAAALARAARSLAPADASTLLSAHLKAEDDHSTREIGMNGLAALGTEDATATLVALLPDADGVMAWRALRQVDPDGPPLDPAAWAAWHKARFAPKKPAPAPLAPK